MADDPWAKFNPQPAPTGSQPAPPPSPEPDEDKPGYARSFAGGALQGALFDPVTGINQLIEHASSNKIGLPDSVKQWLDDYKEKYTGEGNITGKAGDVVGTIGSLLIPGTAAVKGAGWLGRAARALPGAATEGTESLGRLARIVRTPPKAAPWSKLDRATSGAGEAKKALLKDKELPGEAVPRTMPKVTAPEEAGRQASTAEKAIIGAAGGTVGGAVSPVDEDQGDFKKQKESQIIGGALGGALLGTPGAASGAASAAIMGSAHTFGWPATIVGLSFLTPSLGALASHHQGWQAAYHIHGLFNKLLQRPGAAYAGGRAAAPLTAPFGGATLEQLDNQ